jgi:hypothetical protein
VVSYKVEGRPTTIGLSLIFFVALVFSACLLLSRGEYTPPPYLSDSYDKYVPEPTEYLYSAGGCDMQMVPLPNGTDPDQFNPCQCVYATTAAELELICPSEYGPRQENCIHTNELSCQNLQYTSLDVNETNDFEGVFNKRCVCLCVCVCVCVCQDMHRRKSPAIDT